MDNVITRRDKGKTIDMNDDPSKGHFFPGTGDEHVVDYEKQLHEVSEEDIIAMEFQSLDEAESFYKNYSVAKGFGIRKGSTRFNTEKVLVGRQFVCNREGHRHEVNITNPNRSRQQPALTRTGCKAQLLLRRNKDGNWVVSQFEDSHNHEMVSATQVCFLRSNRQVTQSDLAEAKALKSSGVRTCHALNYIAKRSGGTQHMGFTKKDLYNCLDAARTHEILAGDVEATLLFFDVKSKFDPGSYMQYTFNEDRTLQNLFWTDSTSRADYACFGDVLAFDTTYKKNSYNRPLLVLVGVNNHAQTVVFGFALLVNETIETFCWALETFLHAMHDKRPISVIIDGDKAMQRAIRQVFPGTCHRLCTWHLARNARSNLQEPQVVQDFQACMLRWWNVDEFEHAWKTMVTKFDLHEHPRINVKYKTKHMWAQAYLSGHFFGTLKVTSRCEAMHAYLARYINKKGTMLEFVRAMDDAVNSIRHLELEADYNCRHTKPYLNHPLATIEGHAASVYTRGALKLFQTELNREALYFVHNHTDVDRHNRSYVLQKYMQPDRKVVVTFNQVKEIISCTCMKLETDGIPCRHSIHIMKVEQLSRIPASQIIHRWTITAKDIAPAIVHHQVDPEYSSMLRQASLKSSCNRLCYVASKSIETFNTTSREIAGLTVRMEDMCKLVLAPNDTIRAVEPIRDPIRVKPTGKRATRPSPEEKNKVRKCSICNNPGHTKRKCTALDIGLGSIAESGKYDSGTGSMDDENMENGPIQSTVLRTSQVSSHTASTDWWLNEDFQPSSLNIAESGSLNQTPQMLNNHTQGQQFHLDQSIGYQFDHHFLPHLN